MSFGPSNETKTAENNLSGASNLALNTAFPLDVETAQNLLKQGGGILQTGQQTVQPGINFLNTVLNGNRSNTTALMQPQINDITAGNQNTLKALSTLTPRGGGRSGALFGASYAPTGQISNLFNTARTTAASTLPGIGLAQEGIGTNIMGQGANLFNTGNNAIAASTGANSTLGNIAQNQQQQTNSLFGGIGQMASNGALLGLLASGAIAL